MANTSPTAESALLAAPPVSATDLIAFPATLPLYAKYTTLAFIATSTGEDDVGALLVARFVRLVAFVPISITAVGRLPEPEPPRLALPKITRVPDTSNPVGLMEQRLPLQLAIWVLLVMSVVMTPPVLATRRREKSLDVK